MQGGGGFDCLLGGAGDDSPSANDTGRDNVSGNSGNDTAISDAADLVTSCEIKA